MIRPMIYGIDPRTGGLIPHKAGITLGFELDLLARHVERQDAIAPLMKKTSPGRTPSAHPERPLPQRILELLPIGRGAALHPFEVLALLPAGTDRNNVAHYLSKLFRKGRCRRIGPLGHSRYYRQS